MKAILVAAFAVAATTSAAAGKPDCLPEIHGVMRTRFEMTTEDQVRYRFQVRNARVTLGGDIGPAVKYFVQTDLCDRGKMKILDAWGRISIARGLALQAGQFRMPFGVETFRAPATYIFANRTYMGKQMFNYRAVGAKLAYRLPALPLTVEAGAFNPRTIGDHDTWDDRLSAAGKMTWQNGAWTLSAGAATHATDTVRANLLDGAAVFSHGHWEMQAEYMFEHYVSSPAPNAHAWAFWANYTMPVRAGIFDRLSFQGRYDGITRHASLASATLFDPARNRVTAGVTLGTHVASGLFAELRANYEKAFFHRGHTVTPGESSRAILEMVLRF